MADPLRETLRAEIARHRRSVQLSVHEYVERPPFPRAMMVEVTNACNHSCFFCANTRMERRRRILSVQLYERIILEARALGVDELTLYSTGEPLLHPQFVRLVSTATMLGIANVTTTTNGVKLTEETSTSCIQAGLRAIRVSMNAGDRDTYLAVHGRDDFDQVVENVRACDRARKRCGTEVRLAVTCTVTDRNEPTAERLTEIVGPYVDEVLFLPVGPQSGLMADIARLHRPKGFLARNPSAAYEVPQGYTPCAYPFRRIHLTAEGFLSACAVDFDGRLVVADVRNASLLDAWNSDAFCALRRKQLNDQLHGLQCQTCIHGTSH